jgi:DNA-binding response OmpR family regulator
MVLLIVEDSCLFRNRLVNSLREFNPELTILTASSGKEAILISSDTHLDCAILDIALPDTSGIKVLKFMKTMRPDAKIIMFTNYPTEEFRDACLSSGADYFFEKCGNFKELILLINELTKANKTSFEK